MKKYKVLRTASTFVLDWEPLCKCGNVAVHFIEIHAVGCCTPDYPTRSTLFCEKCSMNSIDKAFRLVGDEALCPSCEMPFVTVSDLVVKVAPLTKADR